MTIEIWLVPVMCLLTLLVLGTKQSEKEPVRAENEDPTLAERRYNRG
jgi:hypothetical protein